MGRAREETVNSYVNHGEVVCLDAIERKGLAWRWRCSCKKVGKWSEPTVLYPRTEMFKGWNEHVKTNHPEYQ